MNSKLVAAILLLVAELFIVLCICNQGEGWMLITAAVLIPGALIVGSRSAP